MEALKCSQIMDTSGAEPAIWVHIGRGRYERKGRVGDDSRIEFPLIETRNIFNEASLGNKMRSSVWGLKYLLETQADVAGILLHVLVSS